MKEERNIDLKDHEFDRFRKFLASQSGIALSDNKQYLVESRLKSILTENGLPSVDVLLSFIESHPETTLLDKVVDAMTTNETFWFRDAFLFGYLENNLLPQLFKDFSSRPIEVWSAACSSGQEAYSFSMVVEQCLHGFKSWPNKTPVVNILATDISKQMVEHAKTGIYSQLELSRGLPDLLCRQYFDKLPDGKAKLKESVRQRVKFRIHNLMGSFDSLGAFDIVMCRNVLIYFDDKTVESILRRIHTVLRQNGVLFLSSSESIRGLEDLYYLESTQAGFVYRAIK